MNSILEVSLEVYRVLLFAYLFPLQIFLSELIQYTFLVVLCTLLLSQIVHQRLVSWIDVPIKEVSTLARASCLEEEVNKSVELHVSLLRKEFTTLHYESHPQWDSFWSILVKAVKRAELLRVILLDMQREHKYELFAASERKTK